MFSSLHLPFFPSPQLMLFSVVVWNPLHTLSFLSAPQVFASDSNCYSFTWASRPRCRTFLISANIFIFPTACVGSKTTTAILTFPSQPIWGVLANLSFKAYPDNLTMVLHVTQVQNWPIPSGVQLLLGSYLLLFPLAPSAQAVSFSFACNTYQTFYYFRALIPVVPFTWNTWPQVPID